MLFTFMHLAKSVFSEVTLANKKQTVDIAVVVIKSLSMLKTLNLSHLNVTDQGSDMIATIIFKAVSLVTFDISHTRLNATKVININKALQNISSLQFLKMSKNFINDKAMDSIAAVIGNNHGMKYLDISGNKLSTNSLTQIVDALSIHNSIRVLDISNNDILFDQTKDLKATFATCSSLQELNLSQNSLMFTGVLTIAQALRNHPNLQVLLLNNNSISFLSACEFLVDVILSTNQSLVNLNVCGRNIRPRFIVNHLIPASIQEKHTGFVLQNLYLSYYLLLSCILSSLDNNKKTAEFTPDDFIKVTEKCPFDNDYITSYFVDHNGGVFFNKEHNFSIVIPPVAVSQGDCIQIQATASRFGPYELPDGCFPISSYFWISATYTFNIPVYLILSHHANLRNVSDCSRLFALEACSRHTCVSEREMLNMNKVYDGVFFDKKNGYCIVSTNHFCSYCLGKDDTTIPDEFYASFYTYSFQGVLKAEICMCHVNKECIEV